MIDILGMTIFASVVVSRDYHSMVCVALTEEKEGAIRLATSVWHMRFN